KRLLIPAAVFLAAIFSTAAQTKAADGYVPFDGAKSDWHGFDRYDYLLDEKTMEIKPADPNTKGDTPGQRRCLVIVPKTPAAGNPWSWRGCWWDYMPQAEIELLKRGFHVVYVTGDREVLPDKRWDAWYAFLTEKHGLSKKPAFVGMSLGGEYSFMWAEAHPDEVSCIYADNPSSNEGILTGLDKLTSHDVPVLDICGSIDPTLGRWSVPIENIYHQFGGRISMMIKDGYSHHPHSLTDPAPIADFIEQSVKEKANPPAPMPDYAGDHATRGWYYSLENNFREFPKDDAWITYRGPIFTPTYAEYQASLGFPAPVTIIAPNKEAAGRPWVYRAGFVDRDAVADQALLAAGFHIVVGPVGYNEDGPIVDNWNKLYQHLVAHGFSKTPVIEGEGGGAGEAMNWAIANADKVSCIYCEDPLFRTHMNKVQPMDNLGPLAQAGVPILCVSGAQDPALAANTRAIEKKYGDLGGKVTVIVQEGVGRYPMGPKDTKPVVDFIVSHQPQK
ncbi:MAG TPA: alpha/beta hydrolase, partial [Chthoniobacteraceae bacterium]|nr:alpha/beta hydrolase [Chthoniobacteraceae bacterium]